MTKEVTPQELFEAYRDATYKLRRDGAGMAGAYIPPVAYAEVDDQRKAIFIETAQEVNRLLANLNDQEILAEMRQVKHETDELEIKLRETLSRIRRLDTRRSHLVRKLSKQEQINHLFD